MLGTFSVHKPPGRFKCADGFKVSLNWMERINGLLSVSEWAVLNNLLLSLPPFLSPSLTF